MSIPFLRASFICLASIVFAPAGTAGVIIVDANGGAAYADIQPAVDAASEWDTLLVKSGAYNSFVVSGKSLAIAGDTGADVSIAGSVRVRNLAPTQTVVLASLKVTGVVNGAVVYGMLLSNNAGHIRVQQCVVKGSPDNTGGRVDNTSDASFVATSIAGGDVPFTYPTGTGIDLVGAGSKLTAYDCAFLGGQSHWESNGGIGVRATGGFLFLSNTLARGGKGAVGACPCGQGGNGGHALAFDAPVHAALLWSASIAGLGGSSCVSLGCSSIPPGSGGTAEFGPGVFEPMEGIARSMNAPSVVREGTIAMLSLRGLPSDRVGLLISKHCDYVYIPNWHGVLLVEETAPLQTLHLGTIPVSGSLDFPLQIDALPAGASSQVHHMQSLFVDEDGQRTLGSPASLVILDSAF